MIEIRTVETDADYEAWRQVRIAVLPHERCPSVAELRELETPEFIDRHAATAAERAVLVASAHVRSIT